MHNQINQILCHQLGVKLEQITPDASLREDLHCDSLDQVELVMGFEDEFQIEIPDDQCDHWETVQDIYTTLSALIKKCPKCTTGGGPCYCTGSVYATVPVKELTVEVQLQLAEARYKVQAAELERQKEKYQHLDIEVIPSLQDQIAALQADKALLDWADNTGHHDARYNSLREELIDRGQSMPMAPHVGKAHA